MLHPAVPLDCCRYRAQLKTAQFKVIQIQLILFLLHPSIFQSWAFAQVIRTFWPEAIAIPAAVASLEASAWTRWRAHLQDAPLEPLELVTLHSLQEGKLPSLLKPFVARGVLSVREYTLCCFQGLFAGFQSCTLGRSAGHYSTGWR